MHFDEGNRLQGFRQKEKKDRLKAEKENEVREIERKKRKFES